MTSTRGKRKIAHVAMLIFALSLLPSTAVFARLCARPINVSAAGARVADSAPVSYLPPPQIDVLRRLYDSLGGHRVRYGFHAVLGTLLADAGCNPAAIGLQWLKAAYHADSDAELRRTSQAVLSAVHRNTDQDQTLGVLCSYLYSSVSNAKQANALQLAGLDCPT